MRFVTGFWRVRLDLVLHCAHREQYRGGWYDTSVSAQSLKAKTLARTLQGVGVRE